MMTSWFVNSVSSVSLLQNSWTLENHTGEITGELTRLNDCIYLDNVYH